VSGKRKEEAGGKRAFLGRRKERATGVGEDVSEKGKGKEKFLLVGVGEGAEPSER